MCADKIEESSPLNPVDKTDDPSLTAHQEDERTPSTYPMRESPGDYGLGLALPFNSDTIKIDLVPLLGQFIDERFSKAVRVTHLPTHTVVYRSPFDFALPKQRSELIERALCELKEKDERAHALHKAGVPPKTSQ
jgi:hypothetical protein